MPVHPAVRLRRHALYRDYPTGRSTLPCACAGSGQAGSPALSTLPRSATRRTDFDMAHGQLAVGTHVRDDLMMGE